MVKFVTDSIYLRYELTVYRPSDTVETLKEISNNIKESKLNSIALAFTNLKQSNRDDLLSLELTVCDIFTGQDEDAEIDTKAASDIEVW